MSLNLTDTAGIRESEDIVERIGVERARKAAEEADLLLLVIDGSSELQEADRLLLREIEEKNAIVLLNKSDLDTQISLEELQKLSSHPVILFSAKDGTGLSEMETTMREMFYHGNINFNDQIYITNSRHREALEQALASVRLVKQSIKNGLPEDFFSIDLQDAYESLGIITGETVEDDVVNRIFEKFCTGK